jgi:XTP/dITP diphosphohydrolase
MATIVLATGNPHKVEELRAIFAGVWGQGAAAAVDVQLLGLGDIALPANLQSATGTWPEPSETGETFIANATIKATAYAAMTGRVCLADDSGLIIDALDGRPGVISSHYGTDGREDGVPRAVRDARNNARVLRELEGVEDAKRSARFVCVMVLADPGAGVLARATGLMEGRIGQPGLGSGSGSNSVPRGEHGFGYDPLFLVAPGFSQTGAELAPEVKNTLSHRAAAARQMARMIQTLLSHGRLG